MVVTSGFIKVMMNTTSFLTAAKKELISLKLPLYNLRCGVSNKTYSDNYYPDSCSGHNVLTILDFRLGDLFEKYI